MDSTAGTICILLAGVGVVVGGILWGRLHAFLALLLAGLVVGLLTPTTARERFAIEQAAAAVVAHEADALTVTTNNGKPKPARDRASRDAGVRPGEQFVLLRIDPATRRYRKLTDLVVTELHPSSDGGAEHAVLTPLDDFPLDDYQPGDRVLQPLEVQRARAAAQATIGARLASGFGGTCGSIGILIALAGIVGKCLLDSGAADRVIRTMLRWFGERGAPLSFTCSGFLLGIPVFFDTVFYLMIPLGKALRVRTGRNYLLYVLTIVCGATMAHSLVPPTPGPLFVAEELGVNLGVMIVGGTIVGLFAAASGLAFAVWANRRCDLPLRETDDFKLTDAEQALHVDESSLPPFWLSIAPVLLPVLLIAGLTVLKELALWNQLDPTVRLVASTLGEKNVALALAAVIGLATLIRQRRQNLAALADSVQKALASAGVIILITAAGGAFGGVLRETGIESLIHRLPAGSPQLLCLLAFLVTVAIRSAQGSATVAMITAAGLFADVDIGAHPLYLGLAIGCGSKPFAWMNDSGFWVITRMSGMTEAEGLRFITPMTALMGFVGLLAVLAGVTILPQF